MNSWAELIQEYILTYPVNNLDISNVIVALYIIGWPNQDKSSEENTQTIFELQGHFIQDNLTETDAYKFLQDLEEFSEKTLEDLEK